jgi:hypothetical protein
VQPTEERRGVMAKKQTRIGFQVGLYLDPRDDDEVFGDREEACESCRVTSLGKADVVFCVYEVGPKVCELIAIWINGKQFSEAA